jgi:predicted phage-related endonuclease
MPEKPKIAVYTPQKINNAELLGVFPANSPEWHTAREKGIGGSEIGTIMGLNQWESAFTLYHKRKGLIENPPLDNWSVRFGKAFEQPILELFAEEHPELEIMTTGTYSRGIYHANPDAIARDRKSGELFVVEVKTARAGWDAIPASYYAQLQWYLQVLGIKRGVIVAVAGWNYEERWVDADEMFQAAAQASADRFWEYLQTDKRPDWDGSESTYQTVRELHPDIEDVSVEIDGAHQIAQLNDEFNAAKEKLTKAKSQLLNEMGKAKHAHILVNGKEVRIASRQARGDGVPFLVIRS